MKKIDPTPTIINLKLIRYMVCAGGSISPAFFVNLMVPIDYPLSLSQQLLVI